LKKIIILTNSLFAKVRDKIGPMYYVLICVILFGSYLAFIAGRGKAEKSEYYYVMAKNPDIAIIGIYQNIIIGVNYDKDSKIIDGIFIIQKIGEKSRLEIMRGKIGPLKQDKSK
jgi:hypothetical protein